MPVYKVSESINLQWGLSQENVLVFEGKCKNTPINLEIQVGFLWGLLIKRKTKGQLSDL